MKAKKALVMLAVLLSANLALPLVTQAESLDSLNEKEQVAKRQGEEISVEVQVALNDVNEKYQEVEKIKQEIDQNKKTIDQSKQEIKETEATIEKRKEAVAQRLKDVQINGSNERNLQALLDAETVAEFINRAYAVRVLHQAEKDKIASLDNQRQKLVDLNQKLEDTQTSLKDNQVSLEVEADSLNEKVDSLKQKLTDNQVTLSEIAKNKEAEKTRIATENAKKEAAEKQAKEEAQKQAEKEKEEAQQAKEKEEAQKLAAENAEKETEPAKEESNEKPKEDTSKEEVPTSGATRMMESTAYSYSEPGSGHITASGLDLYDNPQAIAVDPSVIPLNSIVNVEGYGVAIAADTGGAIKGNIIDVHFTTVEKCVAWGRRQVKVTVMS
ncbi:3D domain-containing protein [Enterococcus thailandicus]|uniref:3D domain-containing protein n=1 Tax=Enterococcus thailandicus TaxID=417368 RepID=UPI0022EC1263|nr:3D domain-containing protein [Enterococcus thailandicus]MDA3973966.1 3D domain-containing protein [Enterococcus thailandicus]MDA3976224.1 3D domain-containing protein [Enterococcus thailandicus]MDA3981189.1 3D domain-containing protein [Enterococcus thailandicus]